jgi:outer membrane protein TolC
MFAVNVNPYGFSRGSFMNDRLPSNHGRNGGSGGAGRRALASLLVLLAAGPVYPAQLELKASGPAAAAPQVVVKDNVVELSLEQVVELALSQNLGIVLQRYNRQQAALGVYQALGIYDLLGTADLTASNNRQPNFSQFQSSSDKRAALSFGVSQLLPYGGDLSVSTSATRSESNLNFVNPTYGSGLSFAYTQPLLRNFGRLSTEHQLLIARSNSAVSRQEFERQATLILQQAIDSYWNLVEARAQLGVAQESLGLAKELHERNKVQVQVGTLAPLELVQSEAQIATNEQNIITAQANLGNAADALRQLVNLPSGDLWDKEIRPVTEAQTEHIAINLADAVKAAFDRRPDVREQLITVERYNVDSQFFRSQKKPQLDLSVSYGLNGVGQDVSGAYRQINGFDFPSWRGELRLSVPIQNRAARAQSVISDLDYEKAKIQLASLRSQVLTEVRTAARGVDTAAKQIDAAKATRGFQEKNLDAERKKYENGMSTSFEITRIQSDLTSARSIEVSAIVQYRRALVEYYRATGRLLDTQGIVVADDEPQVQRFGFHNDAIEGYEPNRQAPAVVKEGQPNVPAQPGVAPAPPAPPTPPAKGNGSHGGQ